MFQEVSGMEIIKMSSVTVVFLLHGVFAFTGELPVNFTSSSFNKLFQLQDYKFVSRVQVYVLFAKLDDANIRRVTNPQCTLIG